MKKNKFGKHSYTYNECVRVGKEEYQFVPIEFKGTCHIFHNNDGACVKFCDDCCGCFPQKEQAEGCDVGVWKTKTEE